MNSKVSTQCIEEGDSYLKKERDFSLKGKERNLKHG